jgi:multisubunit Na+/H+ antiporter MnhB subunit
MTDLVVRLLFPFSIVVGTSLWLKGYATVGDGFSAGAVAGLGAVLQYVCLDHETASQRVRSSWALRMVTIGLAIVVLLSLGPAFFGEPPVTHLPHPGAKSWSVGILELHTAVLFDLGIAIAVYGTIVATFDRLFPPFEEEQP